MLYFLENILKNNLLVLPIVVAAGIILHCETAFFENNFYVLFGISAALYILYRFFLYQYSLYNINLDKAVFEKNSNVIPTKNGLFLLTSTVVAFLLFGIALGYLAMSLRVSFVTTKNSITEQLGPITFVGQVKEFNIRDNGVRLFFSEIYKISDDNKLEKIDVGTIRINWRQSIDINKKIIGEWYEVKGVLMPPPKPAFPRSFDFSRHAFFKGIGAIGYAVQRPRWMSHERFHEKFPTIATVQRSSISDNFDEFINTLRKDVTKKIKDVVPGASGGIGAAILVGENSQISETDYYALRVSGLAHIIAISGMHVVVVVAIVFLLMQLIILHIVPRITGIQVALYWSVPKLAALFSIFISTFYVILSGAPVSAQRAIITASAVMLCLVYDVQMNPIKSLCFAATVMLLITPEVAFSPGLQMSFAACFALVKTFSMLDRPIKKITTKLTKNKNKIIAALFFFLEYFIKLSVASLAASLATAPFIIYHFNQFAPYGIFANLVCVPLSDFIIMPLGMLGIILIPFGFEKWPFIGLGKSIDFMLSIAHNVSDWPHADIHTIAVDSSGIALIALGIFLICSSHMLVSYLVGIIMIVGGFSLNENYDDIILIISGNKKIFAVRDDTVSDFNEQKFIFSSRQPEKFTQEVWKQKIGNDKFQKQNINHFYKKKQIKNCNSTICVVDAQKKLLILNKNDSELFKLSCSEMVPHIFINMQGDEKCHLSPINITNSDLNDNGTHLFIQRDNKLIMKNLKESFIIE